MTDIKSREERANKLGNDLSEMNPGSNQIDLILAYADEVRGECADQHCIICDYCCECEAKEDCPERSAIMSKGAEG